MKSYTDIEQSKKLTKILPLESADMYWFRNNVEVPCVYPKDMMKDSVSVTCPCWSLAALLGVLPKIHGGKPAISLDDNYITYPHMRGLHTKAESLVDACVAMIEKLHELNLL